VGSDRAETWLGIIRDALIVMLATFMLIFETVFARTPNVEIIGAALALFGLPPVLRLDLRTPRRSAPGIPHRAEDEKEDDDFEDRWSHMP
jgi:hypothetical protein